jgi:hypothetical protein
MKNFQTLLKDKGYYNGAIDGIIGPMSLAATQKFVTDEITKRGWVLPKSEFVWIRTDQVLDNKFADFSVRFNDGKADMVMACSTVPGDYYIFNPLTVGGITGAAIACEQQVLGSHTFTTSANWKSLWLELPILCKLVRLKFTEMVIKIEKLIKLSKLKVIMGLIFTELVLDH